MIRVEGPNFEAFFRDKFFKLFMEQCGPISYKNIFGCSVKIPGAKWATFFPVIFVCQE